MLTVIVLANLTLFVDYDRVYPLSICGNYRRWQLEFKKREVDVLEDRVEHLSYNEFVKLKEGNIVPEMEEYCKER